MNRRLSISSMLALVPGGLALILMILSQDGPAAHVRVVTGIVLLCLVAIWSLPLFRKGWLAGLMCCGGVAFGGWTVLFDVHHLAEDQAAEIAIWVFVLGLGFLAWRG
ncbi:MAG: hypothetical protein GY726_03810, partial [Proteobacteria bacterium]|nr:hypothetical protein [Pseudomonadota bacterium]